MTVNDKALNAIINKLKKHFRLNNLEQCDLWMSKLFMNMPIKDLENRVVVMKNKWIKENSYTDTRKHIIEMANIILTERKK